MCIKYILSTLILLTILLISYLTIIYNLYKTDSKNYKNNRIYKKILFSNLKRYLKSGDLLFFSFTNLDIKTRSWINSRFPHVGMVIEINNKFYVMEINSNVRMNSSHINLISGFTVTPIFDRIVNYSGSVYYSSLKTKLSKEQEKLLKNYINEKNKYNYNKTSSIIYSLLSHSNKVDKYNTYCTEFIAVILDNLNITSKPINSSKLNLSNEIFNLSDGKIYTNPIHILCDGHMVNKISDGSYMTYC